MALSACGGTSATSDAVLPGSTAALDGAPALPAADDQIAVSPVRREASGVLTLELLGDQCSGKADNALLDETGNALQLNAGAGEFSWAYYAFPGLYAGIELQRIDFELGPGAPAELWIGLADYSAGKWRWQAATPVDGGISLDIADSSRLINSSGACYVLLGAWDGAQAQVRSASMISSNPWYEAGGWWPMYGYDAQHTWCSPYAGPDSPELKWSMDTDSWFGSIAIDENGVIYCLTVDGQLKAFTPHGTALWTYDAGDYAISHPLITPDGSILFSCYDHNLYAINPDGTLRWQFDLGLLSIESPAVVNNEGVVYCTGSGGLYAISADGVQLWHFGEGVDGYGCPALATDGTIYFTTNRLYAMNPDGTMKWRAPDSVACRSSVAVGPTGTVYCGASQPGSFDGGLGQSKFYAVSSDGNLLWSIAGMGYEPAIARDGTIYLVSDSMLLNAINPDGTVKWSHPDAVGGGKPRVPVVDENGTVYVVAGDMYEYIDSAVIAFNVDGSVKWNLSLASTSQYPLPVIGPDNLLLVATHDGKLLAIGPQ